jgi:hypothetical protein
MPQIYSTADEEITLIAGAAYVLSEKYGFESPDDIVTEIVFSVFNHDYQGISLTPKKDTKEERIKYLKRILEATDSLIDVLKNAGDFLQIKLESESDYCNLHDLESHRINIDELMTDLRTLLATANKLHEDEKDRKPANKLRKKIEKSWLTPSTIFLLEKRAIQRNTHILPIQTATQAIFLVF